MIEKVLLVALVVLAIVVTQSNNLLRSLILLEVFSLLIALTYLLYQAPDVALAEVAIGLGLSTVLYLVGIKRIRVFHICYVFDETQAVRDAHIAEVEPTVVRPLELFLEKRENVEPHMAYSNKSLKDVIENDQPDLIVYQGAEKLYFIGNQDDQVYQDVLSSSGDIVDGSFQVEGISIEKVKNDDILQSY
ncbi:Na(+)/H(+) antiporter subunit B [Atopococcus tabaci]|uniref:Na(+)/H(+) antiporter subunit B n=1 Tax=Atopococcus tabaci TaxID=269774 RepID=UPI00240A5D8E|nr:DUF4040 domain-containing protein [Atopococcus tabaci]